MIDQIEDTRQPDNQPEKIAEGIEKEVSKMSLRDVVFDITELNSNVTLYSSVYDLIVDTWRSHNPSYQLENILECLVSENLVTFIDCLGLEQKIREMLIEHMTDRAVSEYESEKGF